MQVLRIVPTMLWGKLNPDPAISELVARYRTVCLSIQSFRDAGLEPPADLMVESGAAFGLPREKAEKTLLKFMEMGK